jgi:hypothetical protein
MENLRKLKLYENLSLRRFLKIIVIRYKLYLSIIAFEYIASFAQVVLIAAGFIALVTKQVECFANHCINIYHIGKKYKTKEPGIFPAL